MIVVAVDKIGDGAAKIGEESRAEFAAADDSPTHYGKIHNRVVASALAKLFAKISCPVGTAQLPAVGGEIFQAAAHVGFCGGEERQHGLVPILIKRCGIEVIDRQSLPRTARGGDSRVGIGVADSQDLPALVARGPSPAA